MVQAIRSHHLKDLVRTAGSLPGPTIAVTHFGRVAGFVSALSGEPDPRPRTAAPVGDAGQSFRERDTMRAAVAGVLDALVRRLETALPEALAAAAQAWDRVDHLLAVFDPALTAHVTEARLRLEAAAAGGGAAASASAAANGALAIEGLLVLEAACGLARLCEQRLSSLIRLRVRSGDDDLLPGGRPFLDVAAALKEVARAWT